MTKEMNRRFTFARGETLQSRKKKTVCRRSYYDNLMVATALDRMSFLSRFNYNLLHAFNYIPVTENR